MSKNIVLLSDGTGNSAAKLFKTNVWRLYQALDLSAINGGSSKVPVQVVCYDDGVGTSSFKPFALLGGAFGWGLKRNVLDLYCFLCRNYAPDDKIYCFGFSRGAFTIRVLVGMIATQGLVPAQGLTDDELRRRAKECYREFRKRFASKHPAVSACRTVRDQVLSFGKGTKAADSSGPLRPRITFVGLWDTVAAYGLPIDELTRAWDQIFPLSAPDRNLSDQVDRACHALAMDDERQSFHPVLWNEAVLPDGNTSAKNIRTETITQVWFAGMHASVGGGYPDDALAHVSLDWIMGEAEHAGLALKAGAREQVEAAKNPSGKLYDSRRGLGGIYRYQPRDLVLLCNDRADGRNQAIVARPKIHHSVMDRIRLNADGYAPIGFPVRYAVVSSAGEIVEQPEQPSHQLTVSIETVEAAKRRRQLEERVWDLVWWKRLAYFLSVLVGLSLLAFPLLHHDSPACEGKSCWAAPFVRAFEMVAPGALAPWIDAFKTHPAALAVHLGLIAIFVTCGSWLESRMKGRMRTIWDQLKNPQSLDRLDDRSGLVRWLRTNDLYRRCMNMIRVWILPWAASLAVVWFILAGLSQAGFSILSSGGIICSAASVSLDRVFQTDNACWASGVIAEEGTRYRVSLTLGSEDWKDGHDVPAGLRGVDPSDVTLLMHLATLFKRHIHQHWFRPMLRIGAEGFDEYPLIGDLIEDNRTLVVEFVARRSGPIFFFVNDAIVPAPSRSQLFYWNNIGHASVKIEPLVRTSL